MTSERTGTVSVIIPVWNGERYLGEALDSVFAQTHPPFEVVVVDDGSDDGSAALAEARGATVIRQENRGIGPARNAGVEASSGEVLAFLDADDLWSVDKTERQLRVLRERPEVGVVYGHGVEFFSPELGPDERPAVRVATEPSPVPMATAALIRAETFAAVGGFDDSRAGQAIDWTLRARDQGVVEVMLDDVVLRRRIHQGNQGVAQRHLQVQRLRALKASLDRRRAAGGNDGA